MIEQREPVTPAMAEAVFKEGQPSKRLHFPVWIRVTPFFLSAVLYMSVVFSAIAPLPLLMLFAISGFRLAMFAALTNALLVYLGFGLLPGLWFTLLVGGSGLLLPLLLSRSWRVDRAISATVLLILVTGALAIGIYAGISGVNPLAEFREYVSTVVAKLAETSGGAGTWEVPPDALERSLIVEFPSGVVVATLVLVWMNLLMLLRLNPAGVRDRFGISPDYFRTWKSPEWLVWPTIASGTLLLFGTGLAADVGLNLLRCFLAVYALQGLGVLGAAFNAWGVRGWLRTLLYLLTVLAVSPLLLAIGFFDLWFDFRGKLRQS